MLELKHINVSFRTERQDRIFGHTRQQVLFDVSMTVRDGTCLGILGESGSGKSTMGRVLVRAQGAGICKTSSASCFRTTRPQQIPVSG